VHAIPCNKHQSAERDVCPVHWPHASGSETGMSQTWSTPLCMYIGLLLSFLPNHTVQGDDH
ncbi:hypothetical protein SCLCIDRAFT_1212006, partial [Scleroderma citrinum Foug A]